MKGVIKVSGNEVVTIKANGDIIRYNPPVILLDEYLKSMGWKYWFYGAEGKYYNHISGRYQLQVIEQCEGMESVINHNHGILGYQNLHIVNTHEKRGGYTLFYGYCNNKEEFETIIKFLRIPTIQEI